MGIFENKLVTNLLTGFGCANIPDDHTKCDEELGEKVKQSTDTEELMSKFTSIITATSDAAFKVSRARHRDTKGRSVPWWTSEITILRKRALALEGTKRLGMMITCDKRGSSGTRMGRDTIRQNSKRENLNLGRTSALAQPTPTRRTWCTNRPQGKCKVEVHCQLSKPRTEPIYGGHSKHKGTRGGIFHSRRQREQRQSTS